MSSDNKYSRHLIEFMALMDSFHDFAQGTRVPGGPIDKRDLFKFMNEGYNTKENYKAGRLKIHENEYFKKAFQGNNEIFINNTISNKFFSCFI